MCELVRDRRAAEMIALCIVASEPGLAAFGGDHPGVHVYCAAVDPELNGAGCAACPGWETPGTVFSGRRTRTSGIMVVMQNG